MMPDVSIPVPKRSIPFTLTSGEVALVSGQSGIADYGRLINTYRMPIVIQTINWRIRNNAFITPNAGAAMHCNFGGSVRTRLRLGRYEITRNLVPIWNFGTVVQDLGENSPWFQNDYLSEFTTNTDFTAINGGMLQHFRWVLPRPLIMLPGMGIGAEYSRFADVSGSNTFVDIALQGYTLDEDGPLPKTYAVPFVAPYITTENPGFATSGDADLVNPFLEPLYVQRFTGRIQRRVLQTNFAEVYEAIMDGVGRAPAGLDVDVKFSDSKGNTVCEFVRFYSLFDPSRRAFTFNGELRQSDAQLGRELYQVTIRNLTGSVQTGGQGITPITGAAASSFDSATIAMIGWREEKLQ